jgi:glycosyltransferase involved in cell wall biosynthesis
MLPIVYIFGAKGVVLTSSPVALKNETNELACTCFDSDANLEALLVRQVPHVIITVGDLGKFPRLMAAPFEIRRRWLHYPDLRDQERMGHDALNCYASLLLDDRPEEPLVSIFTPAYRTGQRFSRAHQSVLAQTYQNWEWVIWDDSDDGGETSRMIEKAASSDHRIRLIRPERHSGIIGDVKYNACVASRGTLLFELDHDDEATPNAIADLVAAARRYPDCGFFYSDWAEVDSKLKPLRYRDGWAWGFGSYREETYKGRTLSVAQACNINAKTIRGLVAAPNHFRAWRRHTYFEIGGHNRMLHVADDLDLLIRTFLNTRMVRIPRLGYVQYMDGKNTQTVRNKDLQRHVRLILNHYDHAIHNRFEQLGVSDWIWNHAEGYSDFSIPNLPLEPAASIIADI